MKEIKITILIGRVLFLRTVFNTPTMLPLGVLATSKDNMFQWAERVCFNLGEKTIDDIYNLSTNESLFYKSMRNIVCDEIR